MGSVVLLDLLRRGARLNVKVVRCVRVVIEEQR
jgi:hypothetical protein